MKLIKDRIYGSVLLSILEHKILKDELLNRLHQVIQTSSVYFVFPSARHSRFAHSIGVMYLAGKAFKFALSNAGEDVLKEFLKFAFDKCTKTIEQAKKIVEDEWISKEEGTTTSSLTVQNLGKKIDLSKKIELENLLKLLTSSILGNYFARAYFIWHPELSTQDTFAYFLTLQVVRLKGLLHDIGHLPFSHIFEFAIENSLLSSHQQMKNFSGLFKEYKEAKDNNNNLKFHEFLGDKLSPLIIERTVKKLADEKLPDEKLRGLIFKIEVIGKSIGILLKDSEFMEPLLDIIDAEVDVDRLDFVLRDGSNSGFVESCCDYNRIVKTFKLHKVDEEEEERRESKFKIYPAVQALNDIQELLQDRYRLYKSVINHHKVKKMDALLERALEKELAGRLKELEKLKESNKPISPTDGIAYVLWLFTDENFRRPEKLASAFSQLSDDWLLTVLKKTFYELYEDVNAEEELKRVLSEFFTYSSNYLSLWKRDIDYRGWIELVLRNYKNKVEGKFKEIASSIKESIKHLEEAVRNSDVNRELLEAKKKDLQMLLNVLETKKENKFFIIQILLSLQPSILNKVAINQTELGIFFIPASIRRGVKDFTLIDIKSNKKFSFSEVSSIREFLNKDFQSSIRFFVYFDRNKYSEDKMSKRIWQFLSSFLTELASELPLILEKEVKNLQRRTKNGSGKKEKTEMSSSKGKK